MSNKYPRILVEPPGPLSRKIIEEDNKYIMQSFTRWYPLVIKTGKGVMVEDVDGNRYIDFNAGIAVLSTGHLHPEVVEAIKLQAEKLIHYSLTDFYYKEAVEAAKDIIGVLPFSTSSKVFFTNSGTESIEGSLKIARGVFEGKRQYIIGFIGSFHGRTMGSLSLTSSKPVQRKNFAPLLPSVILVPYPYPYRCPFKVSDEECGEAVIEFIEEWVFSKFVPPEEVAAIVFEPIQGEGGYIVPPRNFFSLLRKTADKYGILLIDDEIQTGIGRTGKWFAIEHWGIEPDIICIAKGIASGMPLGVIAGKGNVMTLKPGSHATTFGGNPVSLASARATISVIKKYKLVENAKRVGEFILKYLKDLMDKYSIIGDVRGLGLMIGVELVENRETKKPVPQLLSKLITKCFKKGLLVIGAGVSTLRISPPLVISKEDAERGLEILEECLREVNENK